MSPQLLKKYSSTMHRIGVDDDMLTESDLLKVPFDTETGAELAAIPIEFLPVTTGDKLITVLVPCALFDFLDDFMDLTEKISELGGVASVGLAYKYWDKDVLAAAFGCSVYVRLEDVHPNCCQVVVYGRHSDQARYNKFVTKEDIRLAATVASEHSATHCYECGIGIPRVTHGQGAGLCIGCDESEVAA